MSAAGPVESISAEGIDLNGDGIPDANTIDTNNDKLPDAVDLNGDGVPDISIDELTVGSKGGNGGDGADGLIKGGQGGNGGDGGTGIIGGDGGNGGNGGDGLLFESSILSLISTLPTSFSTVTTRPIQSSFTTSIQTLTTPDLLETSAPSTFSSDSIQQNPNVSSGPQLSIIAGGVAGAIAGIAGISMVAWWAIKRQANRVEDPEKTASTTSRSISRSPTLRGLSRRDRTADSGSDSGSSGTATLEVGGIMENKR